MASNTASTSSSARAQEEEEDPASRPALSLGSFPAISATAFLLGATTATVVSLRRGRRAAAKERLPTTTATTRAPSTAYAAVTADAVDKTRAVPSVLSAKMRGKQPVRGHGEAGVNANATATASTPAALRRRPKTEEPAPRIGVASTTQWIGFEDLPTPSGGAAVPSVLRRRGGGSTPSRPSTAHYNPSQEGAEVEDEPPAQHAHDESIWTSPLGLAVGAFTIATALVGVTAYAALQVAKAAIGFRTTDEFVQRMAELVPSRTRTAAALGLPKPRTYDEQDGNASEAAPASDADFYKPWAELDGPQSTSASSSSAVQPPPPPMVEPGPTGSTTLTAALARLDAARSPAEWWDMFRDQLDAERAEDVRARAERICARAAAASAGAAS